MRKTLLVLCDFLCRKMKSSLERFLSGVLTHVDGEDALSHHRSTDLAGDPRQLLRPAPMDLLDVSVKVVLPPSIVALFAFDLLAGVLQR